MSITGLLSGPGHAVREHPGPLARRFTLLFDTAVPRQPLSRASTPKRLRALGDRRGIATHATGVRCAQLVDGLYQRSLGWSLEAAAEALGVSIRSVERYVKATPLGRAATPEDIADAVAFLALDTTLMTGQVMVVDGGRTM